MTNLIYDDCYYCGGDKYFIKCYYVAFDDYLVYACKTKNKIIIYGNMALQYHPVINRFVEPEKLKEYIDKLLLLI